MFEIGNTLREARMRRSLDIAECESATKIRAKYLRAMEEEHFDLLPSPAYVRGFLRTYAEYLSLDGQLVLDEYESRFGALDLPGDPDGRRARASARPRQTTGTATRRGPGGRRRSEAQLLWLAIVGVMGLALLVWMGVGSSDSPTTAIKAPSGSTGSAARVTTAPAADPDLSRAEAAINTDRVNIRVTATTDESWVAVRGRGPNGRQILGETMAAGTTHAWRYERLFIEAGRPENLEIRVNGKAYALEGGNRFLVTKDGPSLVD